MPEKGKVKESSGGALGMSDVQIVRSTCSGAKDKPNNLKSMLVLSRVSLGIAEAEKFHQVARMIKGNLERVVLDPFSNFV